MSSASLLGGARGSIRGVGHSSIQSFLGQNSCTSLIDRDEERTSRIRIGPVDSSEGLSCSFSGDQGTLKNIRCALLHESSSVTSGLSGYPRTTSSGLFSSPTPLRRGIGLPVHDSCSSTSSSPSCVHPISVVCQGWEGTTARPLSLPSTSGRFAPTLNLYKRLSSTLRKDISDYRYKSTSPKRTSTTAMAASPDDGKKILTNRDFREAAEMQMIEKWNANHYSRNSGNESDTSWGQLNMIMRVVYSIAMYGGLVAAGHALCIFSGVDCWGGFKLSIQTFVQALGWAIPPMMVLLLILEDEVVKVCPPARAIRDVEDEELMDFFVGMNLLQFIFVVAAGSLSEELFFRVSIQGGLAHALQSTAKGADETTVGVSVLTTIIPFFTPFAQAFAAVLTASLTGSMYYVISCPKDPTYVIAPVSGNKFGQNLRTDFKKRIEAWYERRQLKKIYSPLMEAVLALYLGFEWVQTGNIFGPMITHTLYSLVVAGNGLRRINDNREKLRQRVSKVTQQRADVVNLDKLM